jgi:hypothetical protein
MELFLKALAFAGNIYIISAFIVLVVLGLINILNKLLLNNNK